MRVVVGRIGRPHGIRGEVTVEPRTDDPDLRFAPGAILEVDGPLHSLRVERAHWHSGRLLLSFEGIADRTAAESLRGLLLHVQRADEETPDDPDEYYDSTLIGCAVAGTDGIAVGIVTDVVHLPSQDLLVVQGSDEREIMVPFLAAFVPTVDLAARRIVIDPPDGLLELGAP